MKKNLLRTLAIILCLTMFAPSFVPNLGIETVQAASIKLNKNNITLKTDAKTKLKVIGTKKKVKWSTSNKFVASVSSNGTVRGANEGTAYIYAKVSGKKLSCKVTVKNPFDESKAEKNIQKSIYEKNGCIFVLLKSNYSFPTSVTADCYFYDENDNPIDTKYSYCFWLENGREGLLEFRCPKEYTSYEIKYDFFQSFAYIGNESIIDRLSVDTNDVKDSYSDKTMVTLHNDSDKEVSCNVLLKYYDENDNIVYITEVSFYNIKPKDFDIEEEYAPKNWNTYERVVYSRYEAEISTATYNK